MSLEERIEKEDNERPDLSVFPIDESYSNLKDRTRKTISYLHANKKIARDYMIDVCCGLTFFTPLMATEEYISGMDAKEIISSRSISAVQGIFTTKIYTDFREFWAGYWNVNAESSSKKKFAVDTSAMLILQIPLYSAILFFSVASLEEAETAMPLSLCIGFMSGRAYGSFLDKWRKKFGGKKPLLED